LASYAKSLGSNILKLHRYKMVNYNPSIVATKTIAASQNVV
jgi:hypothetical protein